MQTYSNMLSIPVKMFFNHLTAWLKPHCKKVLNQVNGSELKKQASSLTCGTYPFFTGTCLCKKNCVPMTNIIGSNGTQFCLQKEISQMQPTIDRYL